MHHLSAGPDRSTFARISRLSGSLRAAAILLEIVVVLLTLAGIGLGLFVASRTAGAGFSSFDGSYYSTSSTTHPYAVTGVIIAVSALLGGLFYWTIARALHLFAEHVAVGHRVDLAYRREALVSGPERDYTGTASLDLAHSDASISGQGWM